MRRFLLLCLLTLAGCESVSEPPDVYEYRVILPRQYAQNPTVEWPLIFALHGAGGPSDIMPVFNNYAAFDVRFPFIVIVPDAGEDGWMTTSLAHTLADVKAEYRVDNDRIYTTGMSAGAYAAWRLAASRPAEFAAVVLVAGGGLDEFACALKNVPVWLTHNRNDPVVPTSESTELHEAIRACGGLSQLTLYAGPPLGAHPHNAWQATYGTRYFYAWLLRHKRGQPGVLD